MVNTFIKVMTFESTIAKKTHTSEIKLFMELELTPSYETFKII